MTDRRMCVADPLGLVARLMPNPKRAPSGLEGARFALGGLTAVGPSTSC